MTSESDIKSALSAGKERYGTITAAVNCAGVGVAIRTLSKKGPHPLGEFQVCFEVIPSPPLEGSINVNLSPPPLEGSINVNLSPPLLEGSKCECSWNIQCDPSCV